MMYNGESKRGRGRARTIWPMVERRVETDQERFEQIL